MAKQRVLINGHSYVHCLKAFFQKKKHMKAFSSLSGIADIYFHGVGGRTGPRPGVTKTKTLEN